MKKLLPLLFSLLLSFSSYGEVELDFSSDTFCDQSPKAQLRNGLFYLPNQEKPYSGENLCVYLSNGQYFSQGKIDDGIRTGDWTYWKENGQKKEVAYYKNGEIVAGTEYAYHENGQISAEVNLKDGKRHGKWTSWHENGQLKWEATYKNDLPDGKTNGWFENGQIEYEGSFKNGTGVNIGFYENGQRRSEVSLKGGKGHGKWTEWYENGQIKSERNYKDDDLHGIWTTWHENGQKKEERNYINNNEDGKHSHWGWEGTIILEENYINGQLVNKTKYEYYDNGQVKVEENYKDGKKDGKWTEWYENGQKRWEWDAKYDRKDGIEIEWYESGQIKDKSNWKKGALVGRQTFWNENGQITSEGEKKSLFDEVWWCSESCLSKWRENGSFGEKIEYSCKTCKDASLQNLVQAINGETTNLDGQFDVKLSYILRKQSAIAAIEKAKKEKRLAANKERVAREVGDIDLAIQFNRLYHKASDDMMEAQMEVDLVLMYIETIEEQEQLVSEDEALAEEKLAEARGKLAEEKAREAEILAQEAAKERKEAEEKAKEAEILAQEIAKKFKVKEAEDKLEEIKAKDVLKEAEKLAEEKAREAEILAQEVAKQVKKAEEKRKTEEAKVKEAEEKRKLEEERLLIVEDQLNTLKSAYVSNIAARVKSMWRYQGAEDDWTAEVYIVQDRDGTVLAVDIRNSNVGDSQKAKVFKDSIRRAVYKASPLPSAPDEAVFDDELMITFSVN
jgi:antitoxin component YwqK of YwqJK toxin-antitoxin module